ncbi:MAG: M1 family metallopeptidase [Roseivirga sp.]|nr:M1 family metallopeptidase [Roseivirga sp.]
MGLNSANNIAFEARLSTTEGYHATTSGQLINQWSDNGRAYFHYKSKEPIENQYAVITGKLERQTDYLVQGRDSVILSLFYYPAHTQNLEHILRATRASFKSYQENFSPYQYDRLTIMEIPRLHDFAMSVPNTIAFSEAMGFMTKSEQGGLNVPFYITAHEVAHQWWGDQVRGAIVKGEAMIAETLSHYAAGIVTLEEFGEESMRHIIQYERGRYLKGRKREVQNEQPLYKAESQSYIHYGKGLINMMALRHYISEDSVNAALRRVIRDFPASQGIYPSSLDVIGEFRKSTPDSLQYLVTDLFERIIFLENRIQNASSKSLSAGNYELTIDLLTEKYEADSEGLLQPTSINDWIELAVYGVDANGSEIVLHRQMHKFDTTTSTLTLNLTTAPTRIVIDPASILMDRNLDDNEWRF